MFSTGKRNFFVLVTVAIERNLLSIKIENYEEILKGTTRI